MPSTLEAEVTHSNAAGLGVGQSYQPTAASVLMPEGITGTEYVYVFVDRDGGGLDPVAEGDFPSWPVEFSNRVWEGTDPNAKANNTGASGPIAVTYREADLVIGNLVVGSPTGQGRSGVAIPVSYTVTNTGTRATRVGDWFDGVYIATNSSLDQYDEQIGTIEHKGVLNPGDSYTVDTTVQLPDDIAGSFFIIAYADSSSSPTGTTRCPSLPQSARPASG